MTKLEMEKVLTGYRMLVDGLQGRTFYLEDDEGILRRWTPPKRPITDRKEHG